MTRILTGLSFLLFYCSAYAEIAAEKAPNEATASPTAVIIFVVIFIGICVGFIWMVYSASRKKAKQGDAESHKPSGKAT